MKLSKKISKALLGVALIQMMIISFDSQRERVEKLLKFDRFRSNHSGSVLTFGVGIVIFITIMFQMGDTILSAGATLLANANWSSFPGGSIGVGITVLVFFLLPALWIIKALD